MHLLNETKRKDCAGLGVYTQDWVVHRGDLVSS